MTDDQRTAFERVMGPETKWEIVKSGTPPSVDGMAIHEPKYMRCLYCGAQTIIDEAGETTTGIDELVHKESCGQSSASVREPGDPGDAFDTRDD
ncbi:hypothetical protein SAMN05192561_11245 [Halopenitus malekzadehii]|uniref:Uncharacterized protein n=1 Tax=Halopenitus malekzadehii TaxID=1267564 RepID=A0A1H6JNI5_9EURY|nr:hypothetical protein [Halopenitus malekzadehii]SEH60849.1 hypothetical protein SAMN05192561_11245 [Halopenitus malekzadehii]